MIGPWRLADLKDIEPNGLKVFSCFHCGGGSTMGYKLAGFTVLGGVEIDPEMMDTYRVNHSPVHSFLMGVQDFKKIPDDQLPPELFDLDVLDGSPPCSVFSMAGSREDKWGSEHHFREGQAAQRLDDLFFEFIDVAAKLKPRVVVAENVKGMLLGNARGYVKQIFQALDRAGYSAQLFLFNSAAMGVPQARERTFFIAVRKDLGKRVVMDFAEPPIPFGRVAEAGAKVPLKKSLAERVPYVCRGDRSFADADNRMRGKTSFFNNTIFYSSEVAGTVTSSTENVYFDEMRGLTDTEILNCQTFPLDYNTGTAKVRYICGMSVPPFMMQRVALEIGRQVFGVEYSPAVIDNFPRSAAA